ncbi:MAG: DNA polymerase III subunit delta [Alphaproteobacteria bacterium]|nr:DNA polymerase III subunit delta [Alphaproteobacteria bacterium]
MKIDGRRADGFCRAPGREIRAILCYGPNEGLLRERAEAAARAVVPDARDPFRLSALSPGAIKDDPARLADELGALAFGGGRRVVHLGGAGDGLTGAIKSALEVASDALLIIEAGELGPRSSLRKLFEGADNTLAAVPCYDETGQSAAVVIEAHIRASGGTIDDEATALLVERISGDRAQIRGELDKLMLYVGGGGAGRIVIDKAAVQAAIGDGGELSLDNVCDAIALGDLTALDRAIMRAERQGLSAITMLRAVARHLMRLHLTVGRVAAGQAVDSVMASLRPPVFFTAQPAFRRQLAQWSLTRLAEALQIVLDAEADCKSTGMPADAVAARALLRLAGAARSGHAGN